MCTLKKKLKKKKLLSLLCSNWRNFGSFLFGFRLVEMFEPVFGLEYHLPSFMNSILTFQKIKNSRHYWIQIWEILVLSFFGFRLAEMFEPVFRLEYHLLSFVNPILAFQKKKKTPSRVLQGCDLQHLCLAVLVRPFGSTVFATNTFVFPTLYHFTSSELRFSVTWIKVYNCFERSLERSLRADHTCV